MNERRTKMFLLGFLLILAVQPALTAVFGADTYSRYDFPPGFVFGSGTSAYQVEGAANEDGRTPSVWDTFTHAGFANGATGDVACDGYHKYKEDVQLMVETGLDAYKFSISWSRLIPHGRGPVNPKGLQYYNNLIDELIKNGIQPHVTLYHFDLPQELEDEYGSWLSRKIIEDFTAYADVCFREFGDRVRYWSTVNEPNIYAIGGYDQGIVPPKRCSPPFGFNCTKGNSSSEPYLVVHNALLAHASVAKLYREKYKVKQQGFIGLSIYGFGIYPFTNSTEDLIAAQRAKDFFVGWLLHPLIYGDYPRVMKQNVGSRLPAFTPLESKQVKGSADFLGLIYYTSITVKDKSSSLDGEPRDFNRDMAVELINNVNTSQYYEVSTDGLQQVLEYFKQVYGNPPLLIYENGQQTRRNTTLQDTERISYIHAHIGVVLDSVRNGSNTIGYFTWSFLDVLELLDGYESSFGHYYVDLDDPELKRYPKLSANWYARFLRGKSVGPEPGALIEIGNNPSTANSK
ncbi:beta-glucosidase 11 isoform X2 [Syzygium oleosum]|uniref:beta-glucosidase 11 isoform X2 n=1 Tax=Syzygium oleosum TaxID=219896 RepID=UPI0024BA6AA5|nr:beta-glucosidase 11 isoform X2 [Syzygium oleosum]